MFTRGGSGGKAVPTYKNVGKKQCNSFGKVRTGREGKDSLSRLSATWKASPG